MSSSVLTLVKPLMIWKKENSVDGPKAGESIQNPPQQKQDEMKKVHFTSLTFAQVPFVSSNKKMVF